MTEGPFTPGWLHKSSLDRRWLISSCLGRLPDLSAAAIETTFAAGQLGHRLRLLNQRFAPDGKHERKRWQQIQPSSVGAPVPLHAVTCVHSSQSWTQPGRVFLRCLTHRGLASPLLSSTSFASKGASVSRQMPHADAPASRCPRPFG